MAVVGLVPWVIAEPLDDAYEIPPGFADNETNRGLRNIYGGLVGMVNEVWERRSEEPDVHDLYSHRRHTLAVRHEVRKLRATALIYIEEAVRDGEVPFTIPQELEDAMVAILPPAPLAA